MESCSSPTTTRENKDRHTPTPLTVPTTPNTTHCLICKTSLVKNGKTAAGTQRWRCPGCGASTTRRRPDVRAKHQLQRFLIWLLGKLSETDLGGASAA
ncbi:transposase-like zinc-binding domain-containing protein [Leucobacter chinensis]|uniref:transposase-like zinc-binding domain-containing protein n=1 Tax=Leucobacter chinensis TaxID=2851010 RepID=UPI003F79B249